jgi:site-specific recombinase XerD
MPDLGAVISGYLAAAEADGRHTRAELRALRASLAHVIAADLSLREADSIAGHDVQALVRDLQAAGLSAQRAGEVVSALRPVFAHAIDNGIVTTSPLVGLAPATAAPSPTTALLTLSAHAITWAVRAIVIAFAVLATGLVLAVL